jgi:hypothetical protein
MVHLAYMVRSSNSDNISPLVIIDVGRNETVIRPDKPLAGSYWFVFLDANNPRVKVKEWIVPTKDHSAVPAGIDTYMNDPKYIYALATHSLWTPWVPQGPFYDFLAKYGAGRELQRMEQVSAYGNTLACGGYGFSSYVLTSQGGPRGGPLPPPAAYEKCGPSDGNQPAILLMSLMAASGGGPPYSIMDSYTWTSPKTQA